MTDKYLTEIITKLNRLHDFSVGPVPENPRLIQDAEGDILCKCSDEQTAQIISDLLNYLDDHYCPENMTY